MASRTRSNGPNQDDLFNPEVELLLPALFIDGKVLGSPVRQLAVPARRVRCRLRPFAIRRVNGYETTLDSGEILKVISGKTATPLEADLILLVPGATEPEQIVEALELGAGRWMNALPIGIDTLDRSARVERLQVVSAPGSTPFICAKDGLRPMVCRRSLGLVAAPDRRASCRACPCDAIDGPGHHRHADGYGQDRDYAGAQRQPAVRAPAGGGPTDALREQIAGGA